MTGYSANLIKKSFEEGLAETSAETIAKALEKMIQKGYSKGAILDLGYTEAEYQEVEQKLLATGTV